jgi:hypothetical protein
LWDVFGPVFSQKTDSKCLHLYNRKSLILNDLRDIIASIFVILSWLALTSANVKDEGSNPRIRTVIQTNLLFHSNTRQGSSNFEAAYFVKPKMVEFAFILTSQKR